ncbi:hypothetical protein Ddc_20438 [Ditylenchus destructor]|nr:hypothetical protein Ddc_20438 [Ditylenchus destructor]
MMKSVGIGMRDMKSTNRGARALSWIMRAGLVLALAGCGTPTQRPLDRSPMTEAPRAEPPAPVVEARPPGRGLPLAAAACGRDARGPAPPSRRAHGRRRSQRDLHGRGAGGAAGHPGAGGRTQPRRQRQEHPRAAPPQPGRGHHRSGDRGGAQGRPYGDLSRLPKPWKFAEVFLFDDDRRFKPRTLDD